LKGQNEQAILDFNKGIELDPNNYRAYRLRGAAYSKIGEYDKAISDLDKADELKSKQ